MGGLCLLLMLTAAAKVKNCLSLFFFFFGFVRLKQFPPGSTLSTFCRASTGGGGWSSFLFLSDKKLFLKNSMYLDWKRLKKRKLFSGQIPAPAVLPSHKHYEPLQVEVLKELIIEDLLKFWTTGTIIASRELMNIWSVKNQHFGGTESLPEYLYFSIGFLLLWTQKNKTNKQTMLYFHKLSRETPPLQVVYKSWLTFVFSYYGQMSYLPTISKMQPAFIWFIIIWQEWQDPIWYF